MDATGAFLSLPWGIYARLSDDKSGEQTATGRQIADCRSFADSRGLVVAEAHIYWRVDVRWRSLDGQSELLAGQPGSWLPPPRPWRDTQAVRELDEQLAAVGSAG